MAEPNAQRALQLYEELSDALAALRAARRARSGRTAAAEAVIGVAQEAIPFLQATNGPVAESIARAWIAEDEDIAEVLNSDERLALFLAIEAQLLVRAGLSSSDAFDVVDMIRREVDRAERSVSRLRRRIQNESRRLERVGEQVMSTHPADLLPTAAPGSYGAVRKVRRALAGRINEAANERLQADLEGALGRLDTFQGGLVGTEAIDTTGGEYAGVVKGLVAAFVAIARGSTLIALSRGVGRILA